MNHLVSAESVNFLLVFAEGLLSFFSPCVLPLIPVYLVYLAGNAKITQPDGTIRYRRGKVMLQTACFILGISAAFFLLGLGFTALGRFLGEHRVWISWIGGGVIILFGLYQLGVLNLSFLQKEHKFHLNLAPKSMNPLWAFVLGFTFSFAWTPCVGPALSSVLILASGAGTALLGNLLVLVYTLGFVIPFLALGLFTAQMLDFLKRHQKALRYTVKIGGVLLIVIGVLTVTGWMNGLSGYLTRWASGNGGTATSAPASETSSEYAPSSGMQDPAAGGSPEGTGSGTAGAGNDAPDPSPQGSDASEPEAIPAPDFTLLDQYGATHTLSDYRGKVVFLNFWETWCGPCQKEMPDIQKLFEEMGENGEDVVFLGVALPSTEEYPNRQEGDAAYVTAFLEDNGYTFPTVFDDSGMVHAVYGISAFPTTFLIDTEGNVYGYAAGMMSEEFMRDAIEQTLAVTTGGETAE